MECKMPQTSGEERPVHQPQIARKQDVVTGPAAGCCITFAEGHSATRIADDELVCCVHHWALWAGQDLQRAGFSDSDGIGEAGEAQTVNRCCSPIPGLEIRHVAFRQPGPLKPPQPPSLVLVDGAFDKRPEIGVGYNHGTGFSGKQIGHAEMVVVAVGDDDPLDLPRVDSTVGKDVCDPIAVPGITGIYQGMAPTAVAVVTEYIEVGPVAEVETGQFGARIIQSL